MNILFVCRYNRFRSKIAEAYFKKVAKGFNVKSAGIIKGRPLSDSIKRAMKRHNFPINLVRNGLKAEVLRWVDTVIIVADDVHPSIFSNTKKNGKKIINWRIRDAQEDSVKEQERIIREIKKKVDNLIKKLKKKN